MQEITNFFWDQYAQQQVITVPKRTILHSQLVVTAITDIHDTPKGLCNTTQAKKRHINTSYMSD